eukprot:GFKZ01010406.1.p1 GENE.GFKZ01010406.1~~GFKZ01010406.1.p1  ORF type:complete len:471 (+),score=76.14 GFKZ01010406.1:658-2070(+)
MHSSAAEDTREVEHGESSRCEPSPHPQQLSLGGPHLPPQNPSPTVVQSQAPNGATELEDDKAADARRVVPSTLEQARRIVKESLLSNQICKEILSALKVTGARNAKLPSKLEIIATKLAQRRLCLNEILASVDYDKYREVGVAPLNREAIHPTVVKITKQANGSELVQWLKGDCPVYDHGEIMVGEPELANAQVNTVTREPKFEASEYCRLLHVLADPRMTSARGLLMKPKPKKELDPSYTDPWTEHIAPLFNDQGFRPDPVDTLSGGVTFSDIDSIDPKRRHHEREGVFLGRRFREFCRLYDACLSEFEASRNGDSQSFVHYSGGETYIMYGHCFLEEYPLLSSLFKRSMWDDLRGEEALGKRLYSKEISRTPSKRRKQDSHEISIVGIDALSPSLKHLNPQTAKETEEAKRDKAVFEAADARGKSTQSLLAAIRETKQMLATAKEESEVKAYQDVLKELFATLRRIVS